MPDLKYDPVEYANNYLTKPVNFTDLERMLEVYGGLLAELEPSAVMFIWPVCFPSDFLRRH